MKIKKGQIWVSKKMSEYKLLVLKKSKEDIEVKFFTKSEKIVDSVKENYILENYEIFKEKK